MISTTMKIALLLSILSSIQSRKRLRMRRNFLGNNDNGASES
jgi:hypothetical protein